MTCIPCNHVSYNIVLTSDFIKGDFRTKFWVLVTMHRDHKGKRENQQDATNSMFIIKLSISTCFRHHYAHHQENKTVFYCMRCSAWVCRLWLAAVLWSCVMSCVHCVKVTVRLVE